MSDTISISTEELAGLVREILNKAGFSADHAAAIAKTIVAGERDGCKSHGVYRIEGCLRTLKSGKVVADADPVVTTDDSAVVRVDAKGGFANLAFERGAPALVEKARKLGIAALAINDCTHFAALWPEVEALAEQGLAAIAMCPSYATVAPAGGTKPLLGTNPFAFGWPRPGDYPYVFDFATSVAARGELELYRRAGKQLPEGWAVDADGKPTTDPEAALAGAMLPFGEHKGSAISTMIELLAGVMIGDFTSPEALDFLGTTTLAPRHGELIIAFDPARMAGGRGNPQERGEVLIEAIAGQGARLPSQRRFAARRDSLSKGITLTAAEMALLEKLKEKGLDAVS
ncbi:Ldh family oxidoreductase [Brucella intermedia]|nr:Ldh family oxidoreductase [Brucella intermedia]PJT19422.1 oxidoreductase [Ochrobactrum sp. 30A/1000/2015]PJT39363.1 oxidoreductase [Ochrobactrum sp. 27A/999/2015]PJT43656.1 oxidoreductase [Ochrobactrum sp. 23A/997/2015]KAB2708637.1 Ldh family oxidoreductase [Brucella intermedia]MBA8850347.1 LDH2 family malate/lactate/ureidoglycolate dehydrogenase [Brucella intermedia]